MPKLSTFNSTYVPKDVEFRDENGKLKKNIDFPITDQVKCELTFASLEQKAKYMHTFSKVDGKKNSVEGIEVHTEYLYNDAIRRHVLKIENLFEDSGRAIKNGDDLVKFRDPSADDLKQDLFLRICGIRDDDDEGAGILSEGEN